MHHVGYGWRTSIQGTFYENSLRYHHSKKVGGEGAHSLMDLHPDDDVSALTQSGPRNACHLLFDCRSLSFSCRYFVTEERKQAAMIGSEHRRALSFIPFAVVCVAGFDDDGTDHTALTYAICELVDVTNVLFSERCTGGGWTLAEADVLATKAHTCVVDHYQQLLGPSRATELHRLSDHFLDNFRLWGNLYEGSTAYKETLQEAVKMAYKVKNHRRGQFFEQLILTEQMYLTLLDDGADEPAPFSPGTPLEPR